MKRGATIFLRGVLVLVGIAALAWLLWEPQIEGRNAHATQFEIYFKDPFLAYMYVTSIPFFVGLYQAYKVLAHAAGDREFTPAAVRSLRIIRYCAMLIVGMVAAAELFLILHESDDRAGGVFVGNLIIFLAIVVAAAMAVLERASQRAIDLKSENDLTV